MLHFLIADDHMLIRQAVLQIIRDDWPEAVCEEVGDGLRLVERATQAKWDIVISDISMPRMNGLDALNAIREKVPQLPVLIISIHTETRYALKALRSGAAGFIPKTLIQQELVVAIRTALSGKKYMSQELAILLGTL
jgi:two-component system, NarL family, invasion response regulator UvrY